MDVVNVFEVEIWQLVSRRFEDLGDKGYLSEAGFRSSNCLHGIGAHDHKRLSILLCTT